MVVDGNEGYGATAHRDVNVSGTYAAGRDINIVRQRPTLTVRRTLPRDIVGFTGRVLEIARIEQMVGTEPLPPVVVISHGPGSGKTALAVHAAYRLAQRFPDAQLHLCLGGDDLPEVEPGDALGRLLWALGVDAELLPSNLDDRAALYRSLLERQRALLVLDNAMSEDQVEPLLPASPGCAVLITSRYALADLEGSRNMDLGRLSDDEAFALLARLIGEDRAQAEPHAVRKIVDLCEGLPLALRVAGSLLRTPARRRTPLEAFVEQLRDEKGRLSVLKTRNREVRASFALSYQALSPQAKELFRRLGLLAVPDFGEGLQIALAGRDAGEWRNELLDAHLLESTGETGERVRFHDLIRLFARERAEEEDTGREREAALERAYTWCLDRVAEWQDDLPELETERAVLVAVVRQAAQNGRHDVVWRLATRLTPLFEVHNHWNEWADIDKLALGSATSLADSVAIGTVLCDLAHVYRLTRRTGEAVEAGLRALDAFRSVGERAGQAAALIQLGILHRELHRYVDAARYLGEGRDILRELGDRAGEGRLLKDLGHVLYWQRRPEEAESVLEEAVRLLAEVGDRINEGWAYANLVSVRGYLWREAEALEAYEHAQAIFVQQGNRQGAAWADNHVGVVHRQAGRRQKAAECHERALSVFRELDDKYGIGWALFYLGLTRRDTKALQDARELFDQISEANGHGWALTWLACLTGDAGLVDDALSDFEQVRNPQGIGTALSIRGDLRREADDLPGAIASYEAALEPLRRAQDPHREALTLRRLGEVDPSQAVEVQAAARELLRRIDVGD